MLNHQDKLNGTLTVRDAVRTLTGDNNRSSAEAMCSITAKVRGKVIVNSDIVNCQFVVHHDSADVNIFWEDYGYKKYKELGLYGQMNSKWQMIDEVDDRSFSVSDALGSYEIRIEY